MKMNMDAFKALELKLAEYSKVNGAIAEHESAIINCTCQGNASCTGHCYGSCTNSCAGSKR